MMEYRRERGDRSGYEVNTSVWCVCIYVSKLLYYAFSSVSVICCFEITYSYVESRYRYLQHWAFLLYS